MPLRPLPFQYIPEQWGPRATMMPRPVHDTDVWTVHPISETGPHCSHHRRQFAQPLVHARGRHCAHLSFAGAVASAPASALPPHPYMPAVGLPGQRALSQPWHICAQQMMCTCTAPVACAFAAGLVCQSTGHGLAVSYLGGAEWQPGLLRLTPHPPTSDNFSSGKNEVYQRGPNLEVNFIRTIFWGGLQHFHPLV